MELPSRYRGSIPRIGAFSGLGNPEAEADAAFRQQHEMEKREAAAAAVAANGGRSAPPSQSIYNRQIGITPQATWDATFSKPVDAAGNPNDWRGKVGVQNAPPPQHSGAPGSEGAVLPSTATNARGIGAFNDPDVGGARVIEYNPAKDMLYSNMGQTSGLNTATGILNKYQTPGTEATFTPGTVTDNSGNVMSQTGQVWNRDAARAQLYQQHPEIWNGSSEKNKAFSDYAKQYGEQAAHENINQILAPKPITSDIPVPTPSPKASTSGPDSNAINAYI